MKNGLVSCIIPTYKRSDSLTRAIESVLNQTYPDIEVIVVDDNNPDDKYSKEVQEKLKLFSDERVKYIQQEAHINGAVARNIGIRNSHGEYIAFIDDDDEWLPGKLKQQLLKLNEHKDYGGISCLYSIYNEGELIRKSGSYSEVGLHKKILERSISVYTSTLLMRKDALEKTNLFNESMLRHQDLQLLLDFLSENKLLVLNEYYVKIHTEIGGNRATANNIESIKKHFFEKVHYHFEFYSSKVQKRIYAAHYFEIILVALREKNIRLIVKYLLKIKLNIFAYYDLYKRYYNRKKER